VPYSVFPLSLVCFRYYWLAVPVALFRLGITSICASRHCQKSEFPVCGDHFAWLRPLLFGVLPVIVPGVRFYLDPTPL